MPDTHSIGTFRALSALLVYPSEELVAAVPEIEAVITADGLLGSKERHAVGALLEEVRTLDLYELQERYVELFDRSRRLSLHLFEHIHGESRQRGQAMVDLAAHYERAGLIPVAGELPDYLPLFLEFLSTRPPGEALGLLSETAHILALLEERLVKRGSTYASVFTAILSLDAGAKGHAGDTEDADHPDDLAALDAAWEETAVTFGPGDASDGCSVDRLRIRMRAAHRDVRASTT